MKKSYFNVTFQTPNCKWDFLKHFHWLKYFKQTFDQKFWLRVELYSSSALLRQEGILHRLWWHNSGVTPVTTLQHILGGGIYHSTIISNFTLRQLINLLSNLCIVLRIKNKIAYFKVKLYWTRRVVFRFCTPKIKERISLTLLDLML